MIYVAIFRHEPNLDALLARKPDAHSSAP
jgi:hypothetical protein